MSSRKKRTRSHRAATRAFSAQAELAALLRPSEPASLPPAPRVSASSTQGAARDIAAEVEQAPAAFSIDEISTAVRYWGDHLEDRSAAKVSGGFGPNACLVIEVLTLMTVNRERTVACKQNSKLAQVVSEALRESPLPQSTRNPVDAVA